MLPTEEFTTGMTKGAGKAVTDATQLTSETGVLASISTGLVNAIAASSRTDKAEAMSQLWCRSHRSCLRH